MDIYIWQARRERRRRVFRALLMSVGFAAAACAQMFTSQSSTPVGDRFGSPLGVAAADFNGDHLPDLVIAAEDGAHLLLASGGGQFQLSQLILAGDIAAVATADFNRDGKMDVAAADASAGTITILLGDGSGTFRSASRLAWVVPTSKLVFGAALLAADLNGDGIADLAIVQASSIALFFGKGDGTFTTGPLLPVGDTPDAIVAADFNGDGKMDLATSNFYSQDVSILLGTGHGAFLAQSKTAVGDRALSLAAADFNRDGKIDLAVA